MEFTVRDSGRNRILPLTLDKRQGRQIQIQIRKRESRQ